MRLDRILVGAAVAATLSSAAMARDYISIAGSSTVLPFATIVAEAMGNNPNFKTP
ncbi:MAG: phosphate ABC transporter substrate-binding protein, partial [Rhodobacteraceae bacterium]|nr:phosphate ABC transporter substrate-binding protein [Paracoccaceae bacterium]